MPESLQRSSCVSFTYRGNITTQVTPTDTYDIVGNTTTVQAGSTQVQLAATSLTNYYAPSTVTPNSNNNLSPSFAFDGAMNLTSAAMPNGATSSATTTYTYNYNTSASTVTATTVANSGTRWVRSTMDGLGRTIKVERGTGPLSSQVTLSVQESVYGPCACTPLGKVFNVSQPHAPGATPVWTVYTYDAMGRTLTVTKPDGSVTGYQYGGNWSSAYDAAVNAKSFRTDGLGNLVQVVEANGTVNTNYSYNAMNKLTQVQMTSGGTTQTRTFTYDQGGQGVMLLSANNPENGTVTYSYNSDGTLATRRDAKNQLLQYSYDNYKRLTQVSRPDGTQDNYTYDGYAASGFYSQYAWGRLAAVTFQGQPDRQSNAATVFTNMYAYTPTGLVTAKRLQVARGALSPIALEADYAYDNGGHTTSVTYPTSQGSYNNPVAGPTYSYTYDSMGRLNTMAQTAGPAYSGPGGNFSLPVTIVSGTAYGPAGELTSIAGAVNSGYLGKTRTYNNLLQLLTVSGGQLFGTTVSMQYTYPSGANIGKISKQKNLNSGEEVQYQYDDVGLARDTVGVQLQL